jgi:hypothetical protein
MINRGSQWRRWEPHIHTPGTILNDQFGGGDPWETYLASIETSNPMIEAIAITDYYVTDSYEMVLEKKKEGRLPDVKLVFPNVELRLDVAAKTGFVNAHLLVSPEDNDHLEQLHRLLLRLQFQAFGDTYNCTREDLIRLGKKADSEITDDGAALAHGATQFKVSFTQLRNVLQSSDWADKNILVGMAGAAGDGTSGVRQAADTTVRQEIEKFADIIFASSEAQRLFWFGKGVVSPNQLAERYGAANLAYMAAMLMIKKPWASLLKTGFLGSKVNWSLMHSAKLVSFQKVVLLWESSPPHPLCRLKLFQKLRSMKLTGWKLTKSLSTAG